MKWYTYSKGLFGTDPVTVPTANAIKRFSNGVQC